MTLEKKMKVNRKARLIVRNISFKATEELLRNHFEAYGEIFEVKLLRKPDGKLVGCGFVHYKNVPMAKKAILNTNMKPFLGRPISVDWAVAKDKYMQHVVTKQIDAEEKIKIEPDSDEDIKVKEKSCSSEDVLEDLKQDIKSETDESSDSDSSSQDDNTNDSMDNDSDEDIENDDENDHHDNENDNARNEKPRTKLNDAEDGCTVFIVNIPFCVDNNQLKQFVENTGPVKYALICMDKMTEHSKGSGFVKFVNKEDADRFMALPADQMKLGGQTLQAKPALKRENVRKDKSKESKDKRNLYLVREGVVPAGSEAAVGVSASDMAKRLKMERSKTQMLKNLNRFVSKYRLVVSNLPENFDDAKLRSICLRAAGPRCSITEARVMRDLRGPLGRDGKHLSKGYGFVMFTTHEHALSCLRKLNNNPEIFGKNNRPIVSFSIEDRAALNARKKRLEKSILNNPLNKRKLEDSKPESESNTNGPKRQRRKMHQSSRELSGSRSSTRDGNVKEGHNVKKGPNFNKGPKVNKSPNVNKSSNVNKVNYVMNPDKDKKRGKFSKKTRRFNKNKKF